MIVSAEAVKELYSRLVERLQRATFDDKRFVLESLDAHVTVGSSGVSLSLAIPERVVSAVSNTPGWDGREEPRFGSSMETLAMSAGLYPSKGLLPLG